MTESTATNTKTRRAAGESDGPGRTTIADVVVQKVAGIAAREVSGVHAFGSGAARAIGAIRERIPGQGTPAQGVSVQVSDKEVTVDLDIVVEYGVSISDLARAVRENVVSAVERLVGLQVKEVNVNVDDVHLPGDDDDDRGSKRVEVQ